MAESAARAGPAADRPSSARLPAPRISVVISTRNRGAVLPDALGVYERIRASVPWELVVVDNGSTDDTAAVLAAFAATATFPVRIAQAPVAGLSRARNVGWRAARGEIVAFTDDDCYPEPDYLDAIAAIFEDPGVGYCGGRIVLHDPEDFPITILTETRRRPIPPGTIVEAGALQGANMAARRTVLEAVGGFDEDLGAGTPFPSEDVEFASQASFAGFGGCYDPRPVVRHHHRRRTGEDVAALRRGYAIGRGAYHAKCLIDPSRRMPALRTWYWRARALPLRARCRVEYLRNRLQEVRGAVSYLFRPRAGAR